MGEYKRFKGDCWVVNSNFENNACITSQSDDQFKVEGTFHTKGDLTGIYWYSEDIIQHDLLKYPTSTDYTGVKLKFDFESTNCNLVGNTDLAIKKNNDSTYFVDLSYLSNSSVDKTIQIPGNITSFFVDMNLLQGTLVVKNQNNKTMNGFSGKNIEAIITKNGTLIFPTAMNGKINYYYFIPNCQEELVFEQNSNEYKLKNEYVISDSLQVYNTNNHILTRSNTPEEGYYYDSINNEIRIQSNDFPRNIYIRYEMQSTVTDNLTFTSKNEKIKIRYKNIDPNSIKVKDKSGNELIRSYFLKDYAYYFDTQEILPISDNFTDKIKASYKYITDKEITREYTLENVNTTSKYYELGFNKRFEVENDVPNFAEVMDMEGNTIHHIFGAENNPQYVYLYTPKTEVKIKFNEVQENTEQLQYNGAWKKIKLSKETILENTLNIYTSSNEKLSKGEMPRDYIYYNETQEIQLVSNRCKKGCVFSCQLNLDTSEEYVELEENQDTIQLNNPYIVGKTLYIHDGNYIPIHRLEDENVVTGDYYYDEKKNKILALTNNCSNGCVVKYAETPHEEIDLQFVQKTTKPINSSLPRIVLPETDVIEETIEVKDNEDNLLEASEPNGHYILFPETKKILFLSDLCNGMSFSYYYSAPHDPRTIGANSDWSKVSLSSGNEGQNPVYLITDLEDNVLSKEGFPNDYSYYINTNEIQPHSQRCANGCVVSYVPKDAPYVTLNLSQNPYWQMVNLVHSNVIKESLEVYDSNGNKLKGNDYCAEGDKSYDGDPDYVVYWRGCGNAFVNEFSYGEADEIPPTIDQYEYNVDATENPNITLPFIHPCKGWCQEGGTIRYQTTSDRVSETLSSNPNWSKVQLPHEFYKGTVYVQDLQGNLLKKSDGLKDYVYYPDTQELQPVSSKCAEGFKLKYQNDSTKSTEILNGSAGTWVTLSHEILDLNNISAISSRGDTLYRNVEYKDYIYYPESRAIQPISNECKNGTILYGTRSSELEPIQLGHENIHKDSIRFVEKVDKDNENFSEDDPEVVVDFEEGKDYLVKEEEGILLPLNYNMAGKLISYLYEGNYRYKTTDISNSSNKTNLEGGTSIYLDTVNNFIKSSCVEVYDSNNNLLNTVVISNNIDYVFDSARSLFIPVKTFSGGNIKYQQCTSLEIDFEALVSTGVMGKYEGWGHWDLDPTDISEIMIPLVPTAYEENKYIIIPKQEYSLNVHNMEITNSFLGYEPDYIANHEYRLAEGYDDDYHLCPHRLAYMMSRLGYKEWLDVYIGATHYYEKTGVVGNSARSNPLVVDYPSMSTDTTTPLNLAFSTWMRDYIKWSKHYGMNNIVISVSLENLQMPYSWKQLLPDGTPGGTGWTPSTNFFSLCNTEVRTYIQSVCEACLDMLVEFDLPPILQWGEPWWWWQEGYPESISIDPDNQTSKTEKYPGQPPAFYDQATKDKYLLETGKPLPVYESSWDEYDPQVIEWLRNQLVEYSDFMRSIVKAYEGGIYTVLYFPPSILDVDRVPPMMQEVNYPVNAWNNGQCDFIQLEDYDWITSEDEKHELIWDFGQRMNYPNNKIHYFAGYNQYPNDAPKIWPLIQNALESGVEHNMAEVYVWAGTQIRRDNITLSEPINLIRTLATTKNNSEIASPLLNIIVLTPTEKTIQWLIPDLAKITEINETNTVRKISITYPLEEKMVDESTVWFAQGNKIFIPSIFGLTDCLYVINTSYKLDYWEENTVTVEAEEVLTELNYQIVPVYEDNTKITKDKLTEWFGNFYIIDEIEDLSSTKNTIEAMGTTTLMTLLRTIEEKTERVFVTKYVYRNKQIYRTLSLLKETTLREHAGTEYLDLNYNMDSLELEVDEDKVFNAMAPILSLQSKEGTESSDYVNWNESVTSTEAETTESSEDIYKKWLDLEVQYREYIPMIRKKESDGSIVTTARWYAPFQKEKGKLFIEHVGYQSGCYNALQPPANGNGIPNPIPKMGTVTTSETDPYAIFNVLANSLLDKLNPSFKLQLKVKDIADLLGLPNLGYNIYETLYVKIPGFDYYVPAYVVKTTKNPHLPGNDSITVETDVRGTHLTKTTEIKSEDQIIPENTKSISVGGLLVSGDEPVSGEIVSINIRLDESYGEALPVTPEIKEFKPKEETYYFTDTDIWELEKNLRMGCIQNAFAKQYIMYDIRGNAYSVPFDWCLAIYYSFIQYFINTDYPIGTGLFVNTLEVHYYSDSGEQLKKNGELKYYPSKFYDHFTTIRNFEKNKGITSWDSWDKICSNEIQSAGTCVASSLSNATAFTFNYYTEQQILKLFGVKEGLSTTQLNTILIPTTKKIGFNVSVVDCTVDNIQKYIVGRTVALLSCEASELGYSNARKGDGHEILLYDWYVADGTTYCRYFDSNHPSYNPATYTIYDLTKTNTLSASTLIDAISITYTDGSIQYTTNGTKCMVVISQTPEQLPTDTMSKKIPANVVDSTNPIIVAYTFSRLEVRNAWSNAIKMYHSDRTKAFNTEFEIKSTEGKTYKLNIYWIYGLAMHYMTYYRDVELPKTEKNVATGSNSYSYEYYKIADKWKGLSRDMMIVDPTVYKNQNKCLIPTLLFWLGELEPANNVFDNLELTPTTDLTLENIGTIVTHYISNIQHSTWTVNEYNLKVKIQNERNIGVVYLKSSCTKNLKGTASFSFYDDGKSKQPFIIMEYDGVNVKCYSVMHRGSTHYNTAYQLYSFKLNDFVNCVDGSMIVFNFQQG